MGISTSNPEDCFGTSLWGFGPWPFEGTDAELKQWVLANILLPGSPVTGAIPDPHPDHDTGLINPVSPGFHPTVVPTTYSIDVVNPITETEWNYLVGDGILSASWAAPGPNSITADDIDLAWATAQLGVGFPVPVGSCPAHPLGSGYGGEGYGPQGEGGTGYGLSSYGATWYPAPDMPVSGGYGGDPYGFGSYGSSEVAPPSLASAVSLNGFEIEVFFDEEMDPADTAVLVAANYTLTPVGGTGAPSTVTAVRVETLGLVDITAGDFIAGVMSVVLTHTGTTLGGTYNVTAAGMRDVAGNVLTGAVVSLLTRGTPPAFIATPQGGGKLLLTFAQDMLEAANYHAGAIETILSLGSYAFTSSPTYPISLTPTLVTHPYNGNLKEVLLTIVGQTNLSYIPKISPSLVLNWDGTTQPTTIPGGVFVTDPGVIYTADNSGSNLVVSQSGAAGVSRIEFTDQTGFLGAGSTYRTDLTFDATGSFMKPVGFVVSTILSHEIHDGTDEFSVHFGWDGGTVEPLITVALGNGGGTQVFRVYDWTTGEHKISLIRNQKASIVTVLWDDAPIFSSAAANLFPPAVAWAVGTRTTTTTTAPVPVISGVKLGGVLSTASSTVFSNAWNFLHEIEGNVFVGDITNTRDTVKVARGPLVKGWGDATPAATVDVDVLVNGTSVTVSKVNPYIGEITMSIPIPLMPVGMSDVTVDYQWMASPIMEMVGLNTAGLVLNKWDCTHGHHDPAAHGDQVQDSTHPKGVPDISCYPMGIALGPLGRHEPLYIGHRYMGFERDYSALLNSPNTMLLNQHPNRSIQEGYEYRPEGEAVAFEGRVRPTADTPIWQLEGTDTGAIETNSEGATGIYKLVDGKIGSYDITAPQAAFYWRDVDLNFPSTMYVVGRFNVDKDTLTTDGVFTGVGMGVHDGYHLYLMGCLRVNDVQHVAMLIDASKPALLESWLLGPQGQLALTSPTEATVRASQVPADLSAGDRFQVFHGDGDLTTLHPQAGVYTLSKVVFQTDGTVTLTVTTPFPVNWDLYGNKFPIAVFEVVWATSAISTTFRLTVDADQQVATLQATGSTVSVIVTLDGSITPLPQPAETSLLLPSALDVQNGQVFFGSMSREASSESRWTFLRYGVVPDVTSIAGHEVVVEAEMNVPPEQDPNHDWMLLGNFGYSEIDSSADALLLKQTSADEARNFSFGYARNETWFVPDSNFDITAKFKVESGSGVQDAQVVVNDTLREVRLGTLMYQESQPINPTPKSEYEDFRFLVRAPNVSFRGLRLPDEQDGWVQSTFPGFDSPVIDIQEGCMEVTQGVGQKFGAVGTTLANGLNFDDAFGRILEARFAVTSFTAAADGFTGIKLNGTFDSVSEGAGHIARAAGLHLYAGAVPGVRLITNGNVLVANYPFDWTNGELHTYRVIMDAEDGALSIYLDDKLQLPTRAATDFFGGGDANTCSFSQQAVDGTGTDDVTVTSTVGWRSSSLLTLPRKRSIRRTIGIWLGGSKDDINNWELPRTDASVSANSAKTGPIIQEMDWRSWMEVRLWRDPTWGVTVLRPDLALPPFYVPEDPNTPGTGFATQLTEPSAGWINVEYANLPRVPHTFGRVEFGSLRHDNVTQQRWERVRYRLFRSTTDDIYVPQGMVLNQYNVITSGELTEDKGHETVVVQALDDLRLTLLPTHLFADRIWKIIEGGTVYTSEMLEFRRDSQLVTLLPDDTGVPRCFGLLTKGVDGQFVLKSVEFLANDGDLTSVIVGDALKIHFGESAGSYEIEKVDIPAKKVWVTSAFPANPAGGDETWSISRPRVAVTVVFVPGAPVSNTYLLNQPLLDGITKLNEGTPPVPMSQVGGGIRQEITGSQINNLNDLLNVDPNFVLNDPFKVVEFIDDADAMYEQLEFMEVDDGGDLDLISFPCEATCLSDTPGFLDTSVGQGDKIYELNGAGVPHGGSGDNSNLTETGQYVGYPTGGHLLYFSGSSFWEGVGALTSVQGARVVHTVDQGGGMPGKFFFASGGAYHGPSLGGGNRNPLGGTLGPGTTLFYPVYPSLPPRQGGGKIYRRTEWFMRFREIGVGVDGGGNITGQALDENFTAEFNQMDNVPPSGPSTWLVNPNGTAAVSGNGAAFALLSGSEDFSHLGPWGGLNSLSSVQDTGLLEIIDTPLSNGVTVTLTVPGPVSITFTSVAVPVLSTEFASVPAPGVALAAVINAHPVTSLWVTAIAGLNLSGEEAVRITSLAPVTSASLITLVTNISFMIRVSGVTAVSALTGGSKITQSSLLTGGSVTLDVGGVHVPAAGMIALGGSPLPTGVVQEIVLVSA